MGEKQFLIRSSVKMFKDNISKASNLLMQSGFGLSFVCSHYSVVKTFSTLACWENIIN